MRAARLITQQEEKRGGGSRPAILFWLLGAASVAVILWTARTLVPRDELLPLVPAGAAAYLHHEPRFDASGRGIASFDIPPALHPDEIAAFAMHAPDGAFAWTQLLAWHDATGPSPEEMDILLARDARHVTTNVYAIGASTDASTPVLGDAIVDGDRRRVVNGLAMFRGATSLQGYAFAPGALARAFGIALPETISDAPIVFGASFASDAPLVLIRPVDDVMRETPLLGYGLPSRAGSSPRSHDVTRRPIVLKDADLVHVTLPTSLSALPLAYAFPDENRLFASVPSTPELAAALDALRSLLRAPFAASLRLAADGTPVRLAHLPQVAPEALRDALDAVDHGVSPQRGIAELPDATRITTLRATKGSSAFTDARFGDREGYRVHDPYAPTSHLIIAADDGTGSLLTSDAAALDALQPLSKTGNTGRCATAALIADETMLIRPHSPITAPDTIPTTLVSKAVSLHVYGDKLVILCGY